jgi:hypothetical protein
MTPTETVKLVKVIRSLWPSMRLDEHTPDAWHVVLDDITLDDALSAVRYLARARTGYIQPADIRRRIADAAGLLPPTEAEALADAARIAGLRGEGASKLHPATYRAYRAMGGPTSFEGPPTVLRPQWGRIWADVTRRYEDELLSGDLGHAVEQARKLALTDGTS